MSKQALIDLKLARQIERRSQWDLSRITGIYRSKFSLFENGHVCPTEKEKRKIAKALGFRVEEITWAVVDVAEKTE